MKSPRCAVHREGAGEAVSAKGRCGRRLVRSPPWAANGDQCTIWVLAAAGEAAIQKTIRGDKAHAHRTESLACDAPRPRSVADPGGVQRSGR